ncbi:MAG: hypothetical protein ACD_71C00107G0002 [uncultured bacterium (gcode 4)]|uniref:Uncharacterized protein n=1 Tax=uncultured bacterium (gcode 4) TaxID=1234023 RepID=K1Z4T6_9BACT|nr:MAG: hypothetical protein ACD_71C00107G0002 [uncultured bacterium (gcode 4)]
MQTSQQSLLTDSELEPIAIEVEKEECIRSILGHLNVIEGNGMEYVLNNPRFQVAWRKACKTFKFFSGDMAKCSVSNIEAFREIVSKNYPDMYSELSDSWARAIEDIKEVATTKSNEVLSSGNIQGVHIGPIELLQKIGVDGFGQSFPKETREILSLLLRDDVQAKGYFPHLNQYIVDYFVNEEDIQNLFRFATSIRASQSYDSIHQCLSSSTTLVLMSRLNDWRALFDSYYYDHLSDTVPQEFLELIHTRWNKEEIQGLSNVITRLIRNPATLEETVFPLALILLQIAIESEIKEKEQQGYICLNGGNSRSDIIRSILATRFPERYITMLEEQVGNRDTAPLQSTNIAVNIGDSNTHLTIATSHPDRYLWIIWKLNDSEILSAIQSSVRDNRGYNKQKVLDTLITANLWSKVIDLIFRLDIEHWRIRDELSALAWSNPQELAQRILKMSEIEKRPEWNIFDNPLGERNILQRLIINWAGIQVLELLEKQDWNDINIHTHALLYKHVPEVYLKVAQRKGFDFEVVARKMVNGSEQPLDELVKYLVHYAFSESAFHARGSYKEFLAYQTEEVESEATT